MAIVVETLTKNGRVQNHQVVQKPDIRIGRAYDNDICINDPYVCPHHAKVLLTDSTQLSVDTHSKHYPAPLLSGCEHLPLQDTHRNGDNQSNSTEDSHDNGEPDTLDSQDRNQRNQDTHPTQRIQDRIQDSHSTQRNSTIVIQDTHSLNGLKVNNTVCRQATVGADDVITVGRTRLRVFEQCNQVAPALRLSRLEENIEWLNLKRVCLMLLGVVLCLLVSKFYLNSIDTISSPALLKATLTVLAAFSVWPLLFVLLAKLVKKDTHVISQFSLLWLFLIAIEGLDYLKEVLLFNSSHVDVVGWAIMLCRGAAFFTLLWFSLFLAFHHSLRLRNTIALVGTGMIAILTVIPQLHNSSSFKPTATYNADVLPPMFRVSSAINSQQFVDNSADMFDQLENERQEANE